MSFKVGDRVRSLFNDTKNQEGKIIKSGTSENCWLIKGFTKGVEEAGYHSYAENFLELADEPREFQVGDRVRKIDSTGFIPKGVALISKTGWKGAVISMTSGLVDSNVRVQVQWDTGNVTNPYTHGLKKIEEKKEEWSWGHYNSFTSTTSTVDDMETGSLTAENLEKMRKSMLRQSSYPWHIMDYDEVLKDYKPIKKLTIMQKLTSALKRALSPALQAQYKAGLIDGELELTEKGEEELLSVLAAKYEKELTDVAEDIIKEAKEDK